MNLLPLIPILSKKPSYEVPVSVANQYGVFDNPLRKEWNFGTSDKRLVISLKIAYDGKSFYEGVGIHSNTSGMGSPANSYGTKFTSPEDALNYCLSYLDSWFSHSVKDDEWMKNAYNAGRQQIVESITNFEKQWLQQA